MNTPDELEIIAEAIMQAHGADMPSKLEELSTQYFMAIQCQNYLEAIDLATRLSVAGGNDYDVLLYLMHCYESNLTMFEAFEFDDHQLFLMDSYGALLNEYEQEILQDDELNLQGDDLQPLDGDE